MLLGQGSPAAEPQSLSWWLVDILEGQDEITSRRAWKLFRGQVKGEGIRNKTASNSHCAQALLVWRALGQEKCAREEKGKKVKLYLRKHLASWEAETSVCLCGRSAPDLYFP